MNGQCGLQLGLKQKRKITRVLFLTTQNSRHKNGELTYFMVGNVTCLLSIKSFSLYFVSIDCLKSYLEDSVFQLS